MTPGCWRAGMGAIIWFVFGLAGVRAEMRTERIAYELDGRTFEGVLVRDDAVTGPRPAILFAPNWMGVTPAALDKAAEVAGDRYVVFVADMYGAEVRPADRSEAAKAAGAVRADLAVQRDRINKAFDVMIREGTARNLIDPDRSAAIGFCFGGGNVLELARSGRDTKAVVSFHGTLTTPRPEDARQITASVLVLHGASDPVAPEADRIAFEKEMTAGGVADWQLVTYGNTVHSFTDPLANDPGTSEYDPVIARRAFTAMNAFFEELFEAE